MSNIKDRIRKTKHESFIEKLESGNIYETICYHSGSRKKVDRESHCQTCRRDDGAQRWHSSHYSGYDKRLCGRGVTDIHRAGTRFPVQPVLSWYCAAAVSSPHSRIRTSS